MTTTFNAVTGRSLVRALESLSASTRLTVTVGRVQYQATGLCSPYLSHQVVTVAPASHSAGRGVTLQNERFTITTINDQPSVPEGHERHTALVPTSAILAACERLARIVPGLAAELRSQLSAALVAVSILMPRLIGWDEDGRPVYAEPAPEPAGDVPAGITEACFSPDDESPAPADDDPEPGGEETA